MTKIISDNVDFTAKNKIMEKKGYFIRTKESNHEKDLQTLNIVTSNRIGKHIKHKPVELQKEIGKCTIVLRHFNAHLSII